MLPTTTEGRAPLSPLHWRVLAGARQAELTGDWDFLGEHRKVLPLPALAELLGVESFETFAAHGAQGLAENGSWVQSARRLRSLSEPWSEVLVRAEATGAGGLAGTLGGLSARLSPDEARVSHPGWSTWSFSQHLTQSLSTPLRQVHDCMELAGQEIANAAHVRKCLLWAEASLARAREVLKDSFSILEVLSRSRRPAFEALSLGACVNAVAHTHVPAAHAAGQELEITQGADVQVLVDFHAFATILDNLVTNAIRHCPRGSRIQVVSGLDESSRPVVTVSDNGNGLAAKDLPHLFEPFFRANPNTAGSGLGLTLVLELCRCIEATVLLRRNGTGGLTAEVRPLAAPLGADESCRGCSAE